MLGFQPWDAKATSYEAIGQRIQATGAQSVYLGGIVCNNGVKLIKDLRAALGPKPVFVGPDGFTPYSATLAAGAAADGMYVSYAGLPLETARREGQGVHRRLRQVPRTEEGSSCLRRTPSTRRRRRRSSSTRSRKSNGTRTSVTTNLFKTRVTNGIMGTFHFDKNGDIAPTKAISFDKLNLKKKTGVFVYASILKVGK